MRSLNRLETDPNYADLRTDTVIGVSDLTFDPEEMIDRVIRTIREQCIHRHRFESLHPATRMITDWILFYNTRRPHQALGMKTPAEAYALAG